jgi:hypothetical protein
VTAAAAMRAAPAGVGLAAGGMLVVLGGLTSPLAAAAALAGLAAAAVIVAFPYWGFLLTAAVVPLERIGRFTNDASLTTISLMRVVGMLSLGALLLHLLLRRRRILITLPGMLYAGYVVAGALTLVYTSDFEFGVRATSAILGNLLFFLLVVNMVHNGGQARAAVICWLATTALIAAFTVYQWHNPAAVITEDPFNSTGERSSDERFSTVLNDASEYQVLDETPRALGTTSHPAVYAINLILTLPFFAYLYRTTSHRLWRAAIALAAAGCCYNVVLANTRAALLTMGLVVGLILTTRLIRTTGAGLALALVAALAAVPFVPGAIWDRVLNVSNYTLERSDTLRARLIYWNEGLSILSENWLLGIGIGNQSELPRRLSQRIYMPPNSTAHNEYLQSMLETGLLGFPLLAAFVVVLYRSSRSGERYFDQSMAWEEALLMRAARVALLAVLLYALQVDVLHFPLKGWWLAMGIVAALDTRREAAVNYATVNGGLRGL